MKRVLCVHKSTSIDIAYGELSEYRIEVIINIKMIGYWTRSVTVKAKKLSHVMYQCLVYLCCVELFTSPWIKYIRCILYNCGMSDGRSMDYNLVQ